MYLKEMNPACQRDLCAAIFTVTLLEIAKIQNHLDAHQRINGQGKHGIYTYWNVVQTVQGHPWLHSEYKTSSVSKKEEGETVGRLGDVAQL